MRFRRARHELRVRENRTGVRVLNVRPGHVDPRKPAVVLEVSDAAPLILTPLQVGRLRAQLRDTLMAAVAEAEREEKRA